MFRARRSVRAFARAWTGRAPGATPAAWRLRYHGPRLARTVPCLTDRGITPGCGTRAPESPGPHSAHGQEFVAGVEAFGSGLGLRRRRREAPASLPDAGASKRRGERSIEEPVSASRQTLSFGVWALQNRRFYRDSHAWLTAWRVASAALRSAWWPSFCSSRMTTPGMISLMRTMLSA